MPMGSYKSFNKQGHLINKTPREMEALAISSKF